MKTQFRTYCPEALIKVAVEENWVRSLAFYVKFKSSFPHGGSPSIDDIVLKTNSSKSVVYRYLRTLKEKGLITKNENGWFKFMKRAELNKKFKTYHCCTIIHNINDTVTDVGYKLKLKLVEEKAAQQLHRIKDFRLIDSCTKGSLKALKRILGGATRLSYKDIKNKRLRKVKHEELLHNAGFTYEYLADLLNCSTYTISSLLKRGTTNKCMQLAPLNKPIKRMSSKEYKLHEVNLRKQYPSVFYCNGWVMYRVQTLYKQNKYWDNYPTTNGSKTSSKYTCKK